MTTFLFTSCLDVLKKKPLTLWGLSLLSILLCGLATVFGIIPLVWMPITFVISGGMAMVYLDGLKGKQVSAEQLFVGFKDFFRVAGGMAWMCLWLIIWGLIPFAGPIIALIKAYSYRFVPFILMTDKDVSATAALKLSIEKTNGYKGKMFVCDLIVYLAIYAAMLLLMLLAQIPYIGGLFMLILFLFMLVVMAILPVFYGLLSAAYYELMPKYVAPVAAPVAAPVVAAAVPVEGVKFCSECGTRLPSDAKFCNNCGFKFDAKPVEKVEEKVEIKPEAKPEEQ